MVRSKILFIEGESNSPNGNLKEGFAKLLSKKLGGKLPKIKFCGGKSMVVRQYLKYKFGAQPYLLIDLDKEEEYRKEDLKQYRLVECHDTVFYMIQEMESWFLSQPDMLDQYYGVTANGKRVSDVMTKRKPAEIPDPKGELKKITNTLNKGEKYHELKHAVELLERLDATKLENDFPDFKRLIESLK